MTQAKTRRAKRRKVFRDNEEYFKFMERTVRNYAARVALYGDEGDIARLGALGDLVDEVLAEAVTELRRQRFSWQSIADGLGTTRQNAQQRWGKRASA